MATHSSVLAWRIPGTGEPGGLPSMGSHGVRHDWSDLAAAAAAVATISLILFFDCQSYGFSNSHVWMWQWEHKEGWVPNNCFWIVDLKKTPESHLDYKVKPVNSKGNQPWIFTGRTDAELKHQYFDHLMGWANLLEKTLMLGKIGDKRKKVSRGWDG